MDKPSNSMARAEPAITHRATLFGAAVSSMALAVPAAALARTTTSPQERVAYHHREMIKAMNALVSEANARWMVMMFGKNGQPLDRVGRVSRFDLNPVDRRLERTTEVVL